MPKIIHRQGAAGALLDEYEKAIEELKTVIKGVTSTQLTAIVDATTSDINCRSLQSILTHVVSAGYSYAAYIRAARNVPSDRPGKMSRYSVDEYQKDLAEVFEYTCETFIGLCDNELEEPDNEKKIFTTWGQTYDIEQMMEHAIVHILRHRRQINKIIASQQKPY
jgi:uncharacterized damage-inducible protein DinB